MDKIYLIKRKKRNIYITPKTYNLETFKLNTLFYFLQYFSSFNNKIHLITLCLFLPPFSQGGEESCVEWRKNKDEKKITSFSPSNKSFHTHNRVEIFPPHPWKEPFVFCVIYRNQNNLFFTIGTEVVGFFDPCIRRLRCTESIVTVVWEQCFQSANCPKVVFLCCAKACAVRKVNFSCF